MGAVASQITSLMIVYSTLYSGAYQRKHQSSASLTIVWGIHRWSVNSPHKWLVTRKMCPFDDVIMHRWNPFEKSQYCGKRFYAFMAWLHQRCKYCITNEARIPSEKHNLWGMDQNIVIVSINRIWCIDSKNWYIFLIIMDKNDSEFMQHKDEHAFHGHLWPLTWINFNRAWMGNYIHYKVWNEITYPFRNSTV